MSGQRSEICVQRNHRFAGHPICATPAIAPAACVGGGALETTPPGFPGVAAVRPLEDGAENEEPVAAAGFCCCGGGDGGERKDGERRPPGGSDSNCDSTQRQTSALSDAKRTCPPAGTNETSYKRNRK
jgi:hypothetical protein